MRLCYRTVKKPALGRMGWWVIKVENTQKNIKTLVAPPHPFVATAKAIVFLSLSSPEIFLWIQDFRG